MQSNRYVLTSAIRQKNIMIVIDHGAMVNDDQLELTKEFGE